MLMLAVGVGRAFFAHPDTPLALLCRGRRRFAEMPVAQDDLGYDQMIPSVSRRGGIQLSDGGSVLLLLGSGVVRCILVTVEKKCGEPTQIDCTDSLWCGRLIAQIRGVS